MTIKSATRLAFAAACLTTIGALATAHAQTAGTYGTEPGIAGGTHGTVVPYGAAPSAYSAAPGAYPAPGTYSPGSYGYGSQTGTYAPQTQYTPPPSPTGGSGTQLVTNGPQASPGDASSSWSARQNVAESQRYDKLLETNHGFRDARMRKECGPISDPQLRQSCLASFGQDEPNAGSSSPRHRSYHTGSGQ
jgi:hypothetical protein